jgi:hypothetical protein
LPFTRWEIGLAEDIRQNRDRQYRLKQEDYQALRRNFFPDPYMQPTFYYSNCEATASIVLVERRNTLIRISLGYRDHEPLHPIPEDFTDCRSTTSWFLDAETVLGLTIYSGNPHAHGEYLADFGGPDSRTRDIIHCHVGLLTDLLVEKFDFKPLRPQDRRR